MYSGIPNLKKLSIRGIKIKDFHFLKDTNIESLSVLWCSMVDFDSIEVLEKLKYLELWRVPKLNDISAINRLDELEVLKLQDLSHITAMPDMSNLVKLKEIKLVNMMVDKSTIPSGVIVSNW